MPSPKRVVTDPVADKLERYDCMRDDTQSRVNSAGLYEPLAVILTPKKRPQDKPITVLLYQDSSHPLGWRYTVQCEPWKESHIDLYGEAAIRFISSPKKKPPVILPPVTE